MTIFYKGAGIGTHYHANDARLSGLSPRHPGGAGGVSSLMRHIGRATTFSPFVSLTRSFGVAKDYAVNASRTRPSATRPAFVYEIDLEPSASGLSLLDPVLDIAKACCNPFASPSYQHDGSQSFLLGVIDPVGMAGHLTASAPQPRALAGGTRRAPNLSIEVEAIVRALRDAEIIVVGTVPAASVVIRHDEY